jgi:glycosyltransferase involved in cell wall biosynthesis
VVAVKVAYVVNSPTGGAAQGLFEFLKYARDVGVRPYLITPSPLADMQRSSFRPLLEGVGVVPLTWWNLDAGVPLAKRPFVWLAGNARTRFGVRAYKGITDALNAWNVDLVHTHSALMLWGALGARGLGIPHVWHVKESIGGEGYFKFWLPDRAIVSVIHRLSDRVLAMSAYAAEVFAREGRGEGVQVLYDGVDIDCFRRARGTGEPLRHSLGIHPNETVVAMVANISAMMKRHGLFIDAASRLAPKHPNARFVVFGATPAARRLSKGAADYAQGLRRRVRAHGLQERFVWAGFQRDIPQMMDAVDVLVHPCPVEGFGRVAIEAMASAKPVVGPSAGGIAESVCHGETGYLFRPDDLGSLVESVDRLLASATLRREFGSRGRAVATERFSLSTHCTALAAVYREVLER